MHDTMIYGSMLHEGQQAVLDQSRMMVRRLVTAPDCIDFKLGGKEQPGSLPETSCLQMMAKAFAVHLADSGVNSCLNR